MADTAKGRLFASKNAVDWFATLDITRCSDGIMIIHFVFITRFKKRCYDTVSKVMDKHR